MEMIITVVKINSLKPKKLKPSNGTKIKNPASSIKNSV